MLIAFFFWFLFCSFALAADAKIANENGPMLSLSTDLFELSGQGDFDGVSSSPESGSPPLPPQNTHISDQTLSPSVQGDRLEESLVNGTFVLNAPPLSGQKTSSAPVFFTLKRLSASEKKLLLDAQDGHWDLISLFEAALIAEGITDPPTREQYVKKYKIYEQNLQNQARLISDEIEKTHIVFNYIRENILIGQYNLNHSSLAEMFDQGIFNCVSATVLFNSLAESVGLQARGLEATGHAKTRIRYHSEYLDIETTCSSWEKLPDRLQSFPQTVTVSRPVQLSQQNQQEPLPSSANPFPQAQNLRKIQISALPPAASLSLATANYYMQKEIQQPAYTSDAPANLNTSEYAADVSPSSFSQSVNAPDPSSVPIPTELVSNQTTPNRADSAQERFAQKNSAHEISATSPTLLSQTASSSQAVSSQQTGTFSQNASSSVPRSTSPDTQTAQGNSHFPILPEGMSYITGKKNMREISSVELVATIYYNRGVDYYEETNYEEAIAAYLKASLLDPNNATILGNLKATLNNWAIQLAKKQKDFQKAILVTRYGLMLDPEFQQFQTNLPIFYQHWISQLERNQQKDEASRIRDEYLALFAQRS